MGGYGRKGAQRLVILETDGLANASTSAATTNAGAYQGYFNVGPGNSYSSSSTDPNTDAINVANQICALYNDTSYGLPGFSTTAKPVIDPVHRLRGDLRADHAVDLQRGGNLAVAVDLDDRRLDLPQFVERSDQRLQMVHRHARRSGRRKLQQAFTKILDSTVPISLVK